jgi:hypothetical protein
VFFADDNERYNVAQQTASYFSRQEQFICRRAPNLNAAFPRRLAGAPDLAAISA